MRADSAGDRDARNALEQLCRGYWYPLYAYARRQGLSVDDAQDLTQGFFADLLRREDLRKVRQERGRFRSYMLAGMHNRILNRSREQRAQKRGGDVVILSIDEERGEQRYQLEPPTEETPETIFERSWAMAVLKLAIDRLRDEYDKAGRSDLFHELQLYLPSAEKPPSYRELADRLGMGVSAVTMTVHRMRQRFGFLLKEELRQTVSSEEEFEEELRHLFSVIGR